MSASACCQPTAGRTSARAPTPAGGAKAQVEMGRQAARCDCVKIPGGQGLIGTNDPQIAGDFEGPARRKKLSTFWMERGAISIAQFAQFVDATGYRTQAENFGWSFVFHTHVPGGAEGTEGVAGLEWWRRIDGADWAHPQGPQGNTPAADLPVTHIAWEDARAYAEWAGGRLPKEAEWEHAARGGLGDVRFPWGDKEPDDHGHFPCNIWQGDFPMQDHARDGYSGPAPVHQFTPNGYGLYQMVGNVWEWTAEPFRVQSTKKAARQINAQARGQKLLKGGSFLCHRSYCYRYRIAARTGNTPDSTSGHTGFRVVYDRPPAG